MKTKKFLAITVLTIFLVSLFAWGITTGTLVGTDGADTSITVESLFEISVAPAAITFNQQASVGGGLYGVIEGLSTNIYAEEIVKVTVTSPLNYSVNVISSDMVNTDDPGLPGAPEWTVIPAAAISYSLSGNADPFVSLGAGVDVVNDDPPGVDVEHDIDFRVDEVPEAIFTGEHVGELTFDLNVL